jgi:Tfp pilus assembly protein PilN
MESFLFMHGLDNFFVQLVNAVASVWRGRSTFSRPSMFGDPEAERRSRFWLTVITVVVTLLAVAIGAGVIYLIWWAFTIHERSGG